MTIDVKAFLKRIHFRNSTFTNLHVGFFFPKGMVIKYMQICQTVIMVITRRKQHFCPVNREKAEQFMKMHLFSGTQIFKTHHSNTSDKCSIYEDEKRLMTRC